MESEEIMATVRLLLDKHARLGVESATLADRDDLYDAGMTSRASVNLMLALEGTFDIEFPDHMLRRDVFESIASIRNAVEELVAEQA